MKFEKNILAICDLEEAYACNLTEYLNQRRNMPFEVQAFTNLESLGDFAKNHPIELLLISADAMCDEVKQWEIGRIIILSEGEYPEQYEDEPFVYKYQASDSLMEEVMNYYAAATPKIPLTVSSGIEIKADILAVYSPLGRVGKTAFALTLGEMLAERKHVLYLNLEDYNGFEGVFCQNYRADLSDLIYFTRQKDGNLMFKLNGMLQTFDNLDYIPPAFSPSDLRDVTWREWMDFFHKLIVSGGYEILILDMGYQVEERYQILRHCRKIYMPVLDDSASRSKILQFEKNLGALDCQEVLQKICRLHLPEWNGSIGGTYEVERLVQGSMGHYVRKLLTREGIL